MLISARNLRWIPLLAKPEKVIARILVLSYLSCMCMCIMMLGEFDDDHEELMAAVQAAINASCKSFLNGGETVCN